MNIGRNVVIALISGPVETGQTVVVATALSEYVCELLGSIIPSACLVWSFVACLGIILLVHQYDRFKFPWASLNREHYCVLR